MENSIIDSLMLLNGYQEKICDLFPDWELVKDEMLLPERKNGSGNGTVHIYLQQNNLPLLKECFSDYIVNKKRGQNFSDMECPVVEHFCLASNLIGVASLVYCHLGCDDTKFNFISYCKEVLSIEENGMVGFSSIFKLSTEDRPYFKQFSKGIFTRVIRSLFIGNKSAYKISLFRDNVTKKVATFWQIGQSLSADYIISDKDKSNDISKLKVSSVEHKTQIPDASSSKERFVAFLTKMGRSKSTVNNYISSLNITLPRLIREELHEDCFSVFEITDYTKLLRLDNALWSNPVVAEKNREGHQQPSASFHRYMEYIESQLSDEQLANALFKK